MVAHPGSPLRISNRGSHFGSMPSPDAKQERFLREQKSPRGKGKKEEVVREDGKAAKAMIIDTKAANNRFSRRIYCPFANYAKSPEQEGQRTPTRQDPDRSILRLSLDSEVEKMPILHFDCKSDMDSSISTTTIGLESRSSLASTTSATTILDDRSSQFGGSTVLTLDTSIASSAASTISNADACVSAASTDMYGWEEEHDRRSSGESPRTPSWEQTLTTRGSRRSAHIPRMGEGNNKRKSLLYRVLNLKKADSSAENSPPTPGFPTSEWKVPASSTPNSL